MRQVVGGRATERSAASTSQTGRFETEILTQSHNLRVLMSLPGQWVDQVRLRKPLTKLILDMDSSHSPTYGHQEVSAYNGHFGYTCYHPLFCFNQFGDVEGALLRNGTVHSADDWRSVLHPIVERYRDEESLRFFRDDAAFASPGMYVYLEHERFWYAIRLPPNDVLYGRIDHLLTRPDGAQFGGAPSGSYVRHPKMPLRREFLWILCAQTAPRGVRSGLERP